MDKMRQKIRSKFSEAEIMVYRKHFDMFDLNGDGVISARELEKVSGQMGYRMTKKDVKVGGNNIVSSFYTMT